MTEVSDAIFNAIGEALTLKQKSLERARNNTNNAAIKAALTDEIDDIAKARTWMLNNKASQPKK